MSVYHLTLCDLRGLRVFQPVQLLYAKYMAEKLACYSGVRFSARRKNNYQPNIIEKRDILASTFL